MVNSNPETVSTDYDTSNELYFEPLTEESVLEVLHRVKPKGFVAQLGGQTPINLAQPLVKAGYKLLGSSLDSIDLAEDRGRFSDVCRELDFRNSCERDGFERRRSNRDCRSHRLPDYLSSKLRSRRTPYGSR